MEIEYGSFKISYRIDCDGETNRAIITGVNIISDTSDDISKFDAVDWYDIRFHCESDYADKQLQSYLKNGEVL